jgi:hypothetical protein
LVSTTVDHRVGAPNAVVEASLLNLEPVAQWVNGSTQFVIQCVGYDC